MGYYTSFTFSYKKTIYTTCDRDGYDYYAARNVFILCVDYIIYKEYIGDMLKFLNIDRSDKDNKWPFWEIDGNFEVDNPYWITADVNTDNIHYSYEEKVITYLSKDRLSWIEKNQDKFNKFLNNRFLLDKIWKKYNIPPRLATYISNTFF